MTWLGGGKMKPKGVCLCGWRCARLGQSNQSRNGTSRGHSGTAAHPPDPDLGQEMGSPQSPVGLHPGCRMKRGSENAGECSPAFLTGEKGRRKWMRRLQRRSVPGTSKSVPSVHCSPSTWMQMVVVQPWIFLFETVGTI